MTTARPWGPRTTSTRSTSATTRADSASCPQHDPKLNFVEMASPRRRATSTPSTGPRERLRVSRGPCRDAVVRRRLDYIELIVWFAFEEKVFLIIFFIAGFLTILISVILWTSVRLTTMLENPPRVRIWSTLLLIVVPPFQGVLLGFIPIFVAQMSMSLLIKRVPASRYLNTL